MSVVCLGWDNSEVAGPLLPASSIFIGCRASGPVGVKAHSRQAGGRELVPYFLRGVYLVGKGKRWWSHTGRRYGTITEVVAWLEREWPQAIRVWAHTTPLDGWIEWRVLVGDTDATEAAEAMHTAGVR